ncbi:MAG: hypothetical protein ACK5OW_00200 [bacterium]|jgi:hypothetical protein
MELKKNILPIIFKTKVGELYKPIDNSWAYCLDDGYNHFLAGTGFPNDEPPQTVIIVKGPYYLKKKWIGDVIYDLKFVTVKCQKGLLHEVLYHGED